MRWIIAILTAAAALVAAFNEVASLDRFAAEKLHFPAGLSWSLPGMVTIATLAGALMWTLLRQAPLRRAGKRLNLACACISAAAVGLDHASGADGWWILAAGMVGALVPALATWLTHLLARMTADQPATAGELVACPPADPPCQPAPASPPPPGDVVADASVAIPRHLALAPQPHATGGETSRPATGGEDEVAKARRLLASDTGRPTLAKELGIELHEARQLIAKPDQVDTLLPRYLAKREARA